MRVLPSHDSGALRAKRTRVDEESGFQDNSRSVLDLWLRRAVRLPGQVEADRARQPCKDLVEQADLPAKRHVPWRHGRERGVDRLAREQVRGHHVVALPEARVDVAAVSIVVRARRPEVVRGLNVRGDVRAHHPDREEQHVYAERAQLHVERVAERVQGGFGRGVWPVPRA
jgi:hypothetical protein